MYVGYPTDLFENLRSIVSDLKPNMRLIVERALVTCPDTPSAVLSRLSVSLLYEESVLLTQNPNCPVNLLLKRAAAQNPESARLLGVRVGWMMALGWGMAAAIGAVAGMLIAPLVFLDPGMMLGVLIYGFAGAILGGLSSPGGAVFGGFLVGIIENLLGAYVSVIGSELKLSVALLIIVLVLLIRPGGLFGTVTVQRV